MADWTQGAPCCGESICKLSSRDRRNRTGVSLVAVKQTRVAARCVSPSFIPPRYGTGSYALSRYSVQYREWHIRLLALSDFIWHPQKCRPEARIPTRIKKRRFVEYQAEARELALPWHTPAQKPLENKARWRRCTAALRVIQSRADETAW